MPPPVSSAATRKVCLLGEGRVGKTSLLLRYVHNTFSETQPATIQASYLTKRLTVEGNTVHLSIWDTAGQERFHALGPIYYRDADAALLVYDITDMDSFVRVKNWVKELRKMAGKDIVLVLAGNKVDMERNRQVPAEEAEAYAASIDATLFHTSAKANKGVEQAFLHIARTLAAQRKSVPAAAQGSGFRRGNIVLTDDSAGSAAARPAQQSSCC
mmetsp:Transcript_19660/g.63887  ORF Transcript_19660/g.63887 Transcript_19660/m.63887 type:complete len:214 (-) Transcript_19660:41-682(-)